MCAARRVSYTRQQLSVKAHPSRPLACLSAPASLLPPIQWARSSRLAPLERPAAASGAVSGAPLPSVAGLGRLRSGPPPSASAAGPACGRVGGGRRRRAWPSQGALGGLCVPAEGGAGQAAAGAAGGGGPLRGRGGRLARGAGGPLARPAQRPRQLSASQSAFNVISWLVEPRSGRMARQGGSAPRQRVARGGGGPGGPPCAAARRPARPRRRGLPGSASALQAAPIVGCGSAAPRSRWAGRPSG